MAYVVMSEEAAIEVASSFSSIGIFNELAGNFNRPVSYTLEAGMLEEEVKEYFAACLINDVKGKRDALADIMVVLIGTILKEGFGEQFADDLKRVCSANMSKFCYTQEEVMDSVTYWRSKGEDVQSVYNDAYKVWVIVRADGKIRKSVNWKEPEFD